MKNLFAYILFLSLLPNSIIWSQTSTNKLTIENLCDNEKENLESCRQCQGHLMSGQKAKLKKDYGNAIYEYTLAEKIDYSNASPLINKLVDTCEVILTNLRIEVKEKTQLLEKLSEQLSAYADTVEFQDNTLKIQKDSLSAAFKVIHEKGWKAESYRLPSLADSTRLAGNYQDAAYLAYYGTLLQKDNVQIPALHALMQAGTQYDALYSAISPFADTAKIEFLEVLNDYQLLCGADNRFVIYDALGAKLISSILQPFRTFLSASKKRFAITDKNGRIEVWNLETLQKQDIFNAHSNPITIGRFSDDGQLLVTASRKENAVIHDFFNNTQTILPTETLRIYGIEIAGNGTRILTRHNGGITKLWNKEGKELHTFGKKEIHLHAANFSAFSDQSIHTANTLGQLKEWNTETGFLVATTIKEAEPIKETWSSPTSMMLRTTFSLIIKHKNGETKRFQFNKRILGVAFNQSKNQALIWLAGGELFKINILENSRFALPKQNTNIVNAAFSKDEKWLVTTTTNGKVTLMGASGQIILKWDIEQSNPIAAQFSLDGQYLYLLSNDGKEVYKCPLPPTILSQMQPKKREILKYLKSKTGYELQYLEEV